MLHIDIPRRKHPKFLARLLGAPKRGAEIGVESGTTTQLLLEAFPDLHLIAVDSWEAIGLFKDWDMVAARSEFDERTKRFGSRVTVLNTDSVSASKMVKDGSLDFVFIDAEHTYSSLMQDIAAWSPKVRAGGFVTGHDYSPNFPGVCSAVDEIYPHAKVDVFSSVWWVNV